MKQSIINMSPRFSCARMVAEYDSLLYQNAHEGFGEVATDNFVRVRSHERWMRTVRSAWPQLRVLETGPRQAVPILAGEAMTLEATVYLGGLTPGDVRVDALAGHIGGDGYLESPDLVRLTPEATTADSRGACRFTARYTPSMTGRIGLAVRVMPNHIMGRDNPLTIPCHPLIVWAQA
jgi:starch phosphorylase